MSNQKAAASNQQSVSIDSMVPGFIAAAECIQTYHQLTEELDESSKKRG